MLRCLAASGLLITEHTAVDTFSTLPLLISRTRADVMQQVVAKTPITASICTSFLARGECLHLHNLVVQIFVSYFIPTACDSNKISPGLSPEMLGHLIAVPVRARASSACHVSSAYVMMQLHCLHLTI